MESNTKQNAQRLAELYALLEQTANTRELPLVRSAEDIVPGEGLASAEVLFIGEAPGYHETVERRPFVGQSGKLFRSILEHESGILPEKVYISNIVKARPPDNRDPSIEEISAFKEYLDAEIDILNPKLIVTLGRFSMGKFLPTAKISQIHGKLHKVRWEQRVSYVLPMYHPAAALRSTATKQAFITDFKKIPKILEWIKTQPHPEESAKKQKKAHEKLTPLQKEFAKTDTTLNRITASVIEHLF